MIIRLLPWLVLQTALLLSSQSFAGEFNRVLSLGDQLPAWSDLDGVYNRKHSLAELAGTKALLVVFTCNSCPYAVDIEDRLLELDRKYCENGVQIIAINVNTAEDDSLEAMTVRAKEKGFRFIYLYDPTQKIARDFGATRTPEFFVFDSEPQLVYQGSLDDSPDGKSVTNRYVEKAIQATLNTGAIEVKETVPIGCNIRFERVRRSRTTAK